MKNNTLITGLRQSGVTTLGIKTLITASNGDDKVNIIAHDSNSLGMLYDKFKEFGGTNDVNLMLAKTINGGKLTDDKASYLKKYHTLIDDFTMCNISTMLLPSILCSGKVIMTMSVDTGINRNVKIITTEGM